MSLDAIRTAAKSYFPDGMNPAHDWHHVERVLAIADRLLEERAEANGFVLHAAILLHDIGRARETAGRIENHAAWGATEAEQILQDQSIAPERLSAITDAIRAHRFSEPPEPASLEAKLLSDADNLDALGAVGIARCFTHGGATGSPIYDPGLPPEADETTAGATQYNHFEKKLLELPDRMYTQAGRELAEDRRQFMEHYLDQFDAEIAGER